MYELEDPLSGITAWNSPDGATLPLMQRGEGPGTLLLIPGALCDYRAWMPQFEYFSRFMRCVTLGRREFQSSRPAPRFDIWQQAWDISAFIREQAEDTWFLVGHSFGGLTALIANELLPGRVAGTVLIDTPLDEAALMTAPVVNELKAGRSTIVQEAVAQMTDSLDEPLRDEVRTMMLSVPAGVAAGMLSETEQFIPGTRDRVVLAARSGLLAIWRHEQPAASWVRKVAPRARHQFVGGGHFIQLEQPATTNVLIDEFVRQRRRLDIAV